jgi:phospholipid/cholesterol/gamma-HCH transport system substrate-binding protein
MKLRKRFSERNPVIIGLIGSSILVGSVFVALNVDSLPFLNDGRAYSALFSESGGLESGDDVRVAGLKVGAVSSVQLDHGRVKVDFSVTDDNVKLGSRTSAAITTLTLLGKRGLKLSSAGPGNLRESSTIPLSRTTPPYDLNDALSGLTTTTAAIDTASFAKALRTISATFQNTPAAVRSTVRNVSRISTTIASRDDEIHSLLGAANNVSGVLAQRNVQITTLLGDGTKLLAMLNARRVAINTLLVGASKLARQLEGLVDDNRRTLGPAMHKLDSVVKVLNSEKKNIDIVLDRAGPFAGSLGESVSSGPFFQAYVQNLTRAADLEGLDTSPLCTLLDC